MFPKFNGNHIDLRIEEVMDDVKNIVSSIRALRKNNNIKIRQPLSKLVLFSESDISYIEEFTDIILTETNIKNLEILKGDYFDYFTYIIKPDLRLLGSKYKESIKDIVSELCKLSNIEINTLKTKGSIKLPCGVELLASECIFELVPKKDICIGSYKNIVIAVDTKITDELMKECIARDFINTIQTYRKDKAYNIDDSMDIFLFTDDIVITSALNENIEFIKKALLCNVLKINNFKDSEFEEFILNSAKIYVKIVRHTS